MAEPYVYRGGVYRDNAALREWLAGQEPEPVLEPDLPIIDPHHHFWETPKRGRYLLHEFLDDLGAGHTVTQSVFLEPDAVECVQADRRRRLGRREDGAVQRHRGGSLPVELITLTAALYSDDNIVCRQIVPPSCRR
jgi:hypothetical protein